jgi:polyisoprenoid-binding protein YceI
MNRVHKAKAAAFASLLCLACSIAAAPNGRKIDASHSSLKVRVYKTGFFSAFAHNHEMEAPIESGQVKESDGPYVELRVDARKMRVLDPEEAEDKRAQIQRTMQGPQVLDCDRFPEIHFQSTAVEPREADHWVVHGNLDLHGQTHPVTIEVTLKDGFYRGSANLKQTVFGITPVSIAGGTVKVKDEIKVEFEISLAK